MLVCVCQSLILVRVNTASWINASVCRSLICEWFYTASWLNVSVCQCLISIRDNLLHNTFKKRNCLHETFKPLSKYLKLNNTFGWIITCFQQLVFVYLYDKINKYVPTGEAHSRNVTSVRNRDTYWTARCTQRLGLNVKPEVPHIKPSALRFSLFI